ncbi:sn-glycerol-1-phosphate dehydrogenase [Victivallis vadensis]|uniref:sn-glycerol-1-phosphate dehydrogenase n=1 Tax=Victivallis vadensis TaxID=172901 RepID=UPI0026DB8CDF|nr:sn-glycerol-1-phosphate dehydrogenase [Victivallis vadensis]
MRRISLPPGLETECFILDSGALAAVPGLCREFFPGRRPWIVADGNTWEAAGKGVLNSLREAGLTPAEPYLFPASPLLHAENRHVDTLVAAMLPDAVPVAVGGGTVNDLVKRAAFVAGRRYLCVPTAASVDGFTSSGASLVKDGLKQTLPCPAPLALAADTDVLKAAPPEMAAAGYADLAAKIPAGADWLIVDTLGLEPVRPEVWQMVQPELRDRLSEPADLEKIFLGLAATGYAMQLYRDSRPASGAEHLVSHVWEMEGSEASHGFKVGIGTLAVTAMMTEAFRLSAAELRRVASPPSGPEEREREIAALLSRGVYGDAAGIAMKKFLSGNELLERRSLIASKWEQMGERVLRQLIPFNEMKRQFQRAGCPVHPAEIGLARADFRDGFRRAQLIRKRYTVLDLAYEAGILELLLDRMEPYFKE